MSLTQEVVEMVNLKGWATADDLYAVLRGDGYTRQQVIKALQNARYRKLLVCDGHEPRRGEWEKRGSVCGTYRPKEPEHPANRMPRVASVWQLGAAA